MKALAVASAVLLTTGIFVASGSQAQAKGKPPAPKTSTPLSCSTGTVTANPLAGGSSVSYSQCLDPVSGNDVTSSIDDDLTSFLNSTLGDWTLDAKFEGGRASAGPNNYGFSWAQTGKGEGTWSALKSITAPFVISLKAGNRYSSYFVDGLNDGTQGGSWATFDDKDLSHASIFVGKVKPPAPEETSIPEPASTAALAIVGLTAVGALKRKSNQEA